MSFKVHFFILGVTGSWNPFNWFPSAQPKRYDFSKLQISEYTESNYQDVIDALDKIELDQCENLYALGNLCEDLDSEHAKLEIAVVLTNCRLQTDGLQNLQCTQYASSCGKLYLKYNVYSLFNYFTRNPELNCKHIQGKFFASTALRGVKHLYEATLDVTQQMDIVSKQQRSLIDAQSEIQNQIDAKTDQILSKQDSTMIKLENGTRDILHHQELSLQRQNNLKMEIISIEKKTEEFIKQSEMHANEIQEEQQRIMENMKNLRAQLDFAMQTFFNMKELMSSANIFLQCKIGMTHTLAIFIFYIFGARCKLILLMAICGFSHIMMSTDVDYRLASYLFGTIYTILFILSKCRTKRDLDVRLVMLEETLTLLGKEKNIQTLNERLIQLLKQEETDSEYTGSEDSESSNESEINDESTCIG